METLFSPFVRLWNWIETIGGYPGQVFFSCALVMGVIGVLTWYGNKR
jgi:hypothetical protein